MRKQRRMPPQPRRKSFFKNAGEVSKPFIIAIITFVAILALSLLLLFSKQFVGRAFYTGSANSAGLELVGTATENSPFQAIAIANIGAAQSRTIGFVLDLPPSMNCNNVSSITGLLPAPLLEIKKCQNNQITYTYSTMGAPHTGVLNVAQIDFAPQASGSYSLTFSKFDAVDLANAKIPLDVLSPTISVTKLPQCGDAVLDPGEECDDGNQDNTDNCTIGCKNNVCGDTYMYQGVEQCDDGNAITEGCDYGQQSCIVCDATCQSVAGATSFCGDNNLDAGKGEQCDPPGITCNNACQYIQICNPNEWVCEGNNTKKQCDALGTAYGDIVACAQGETCSSGACVAPQICTPFIWECINSSSFRQCNNLGTGYNPTGYCNAEETCINGACCGNGFKQIGEECDDNNLQSGDGCSATCEIELGWQCSGLQPSVCSLFVCSGSIPANAAMCPGSDSGLEFQFGWHGEETCDSTKCKWICNEGYILDDFNQVCVAVQQQVCGNNIVEGAEECDLGSDNLIGADCTPLCKNNICGDGYLWAGEENCDDSNLIGGDGCASDCMIESGYECSRVAGQKSVCTLGICGNGIIAANTEFCDDSNLIGGDGCSVTCQVEPGYYCSNEPSVCYQCGNGIIDSGEQCDDGNNIGGDGCNGICLIQNNYVCSGEPSVCVAQQPVCGNGIKEGSEECDDGEENGNVGITCSNTCKLWSCTDLGNGNVQMTFAGGSKNINANCDENNYANTFGCSQDKTFYTSTGTVCGINNVCTMTGSGPVCQAQQQAITAQGTKITLTDADTQDAFATKITATESFSAEIVVYTVLYGLNDKVLAIKSEKIENGLALNQEYIATVNYAKSSVKKKTVLVYDVEQGPAVYGQMTISY